MSKQHAHNFVKTFKTQTDTKGTFPYITRTAVAEGLSLRIDRPWLIKQGEAGLCAPAAFMYGIAFHQPYQYVKIVADLYNKGTANVGTWQLKPSHDLKTYALPSNSRIHPSDWIPLASIRDSANWFFDYESTSDNGGTTASETITWIKKAGYHKLRHDYNDFFCKDQANLAKGSALFRDDWNVMLRIDSAVLKMCNGVLEPNKKNPFKPKAQKEGSWTTTPNHRVALASGVTFGSNGVVSLKIFSWGNVYIFTNFPLDIFLSHYFGWIACHY